MRRNQTAGLAALAMTVAALLIPVGCSKAEAATYDVTYYYLPG